MVFKLDIGVNQGKDKGRTFHIESDSQVFIGMKIGEKVKGEDIKKELIGYEFKITGASNNTGVPALPEVEGSSTKRVLLKYGKGMRKRKPRGLKKRKRVHGNTISQNIVQINLSIEKYGEKPLSEILGLDNTPTEKEEQEGKKQ